MDSNTNSEKELFSTRDIYLAATLITLKFELIATDYEFEGVKTMAVGYFKFEDTPALRDARSKYNQSQLLVEPKMFINNLQSLKADVVNTARNLSINNGKFDK